mgnify:CR=1 FL=1
MYNIFDKDIYFKRMRVGMYDKCWWVDKIYPEVDTVIDFRCADGSLWEAIKVLCPQITTYYGIENNEEFFDILDEKSISHYSSIEQLPQNLDWNRTIVIMNSVVHEICYYQSYTKFTILLKEIRDKGVRHIAIRDMCLNTEEYIYLDEDFYDEIMNSKYVSMYKEYVKRANPNELCDQVEFFLKYTYKENWDRECDEQYLWDWNFFVKHAIWDTMRIEVNQPFRIVPQIRQIEKDFEIKFPEGLNTHRKMFLTKEN